MMCDAKLETSHHAPTPTTPPKIRGQPFLPVGVRLSLWVGADSRSAHALSRREACWVLSWIWWNSGCTRSGSVSPAWPAWRGPAWLGGSREVLRASGLGRGCNIQTYQQRSKDPSSTFQLGISGDGSWCSGCQGPLLVSTSLGLSFRLFRLMCRSFSPQR